MVNEILLNVINEISKLDLQKNFYYGLIFSDPGIRFGVFKIKRFQNLK